MRNWDWWFWIGDLSDLFGIAGFIISIAVLVTVRSVRQDYMFRIIVPELSKSIDAHIDNILKYRKDFAKYRLDVSTELSRLKPNLNSLLPYLPRDEKQTVDALIQKVEGYSLTPNGEADLFIIYNELSSLSQALTNLTRTRSWLK